MDGIEHAQNVEFPFLGEIGCVGEKCERNLHRKKVHSVCTPAYFS
jgi:hypothetical protein